MKITDAADPQAHLKEIANRLKKLSYTEMRKFGHATALAMGTLGSEVEADTVILALLNVAEKIEKGVL